MPVARSKPPTAADLYGYPFGIDGVCRTPEAMRLLNVSEKTLRKRCRPDRTGRSQIRSGLRIAGVRQSGRVYCRRSIQNHLAALED